MINTQGYQYVLKHNHPFADKRNKRVLVHRLVYEHYLKILFDEDIYIPEGIDIHHIDGNRQNNSLINLQPMSRSKHLSLEKIGNKNTTKDMSDRYCLLCGGKTTKSKEGWEKWNRYQNGFICSKCFGKRWRENKKWTYIFY